MEMIEYKGFKYSQYANGQWILKLPSGLKSIVQAADEADIKNKIDELVTNAISSKTAP